MTKRIPFIPRPYQHAIVDHIIDTKRCGVWAGMGLGKTASVFRALSILNLVEPVFPALVVAPLRVARSTWPDEAKKWEEFEGLRVQNIHGNIASRGRAIHGLETGDAADVYTINYENLPWLVDTFGDNWPFKTVVADESTKLKGFRLRQGTLRARKLAQVAHRFCNRFIELTGTPAPNGLADLWGQAWFIDAGIRLGRTYDDFSQRWFQRSFDGYGMDPLPYAQEQIEAKLRDVCISLNAADYFNLRIPIVNLLYVDLPADARKLYDEMERVMYTEIEEHQVEAFNAAARTNKCLQLANGAAYVDENAKDWKEVHDVKIQALEEVIEEAAGMPVLVAYNFRSDLDRLRLAFPQGRILDKNPQTIRDWNTGKIPVLFAHPASAGHGLNLQDGGNIIVYFGHDWNLENYMQILERIGPVRQLQAGHNRPVFIHHIIARNTVEEVVMERMESKREVQDLLLEAMKRRKA
jgi:SNF2 family DNA or RNA helicase